MTTVFKDNYSYSNFKISDNKIIIKTQNQMIGSYEGEVNCKIDIFDNEVSIEDLEVNYNSNYLIEGLSRIQSNLIHIDYTAINRAGFISSGNDNSYKYLIMPLNR
jgi:DNA polymerase III sliding clamp (beta) subunit (PCNA family)